MPTQGVVQTARGISVLLRDFERRLTLWEPAWASPGKLDGVAPSSPVATQGLPHHFYAIHREAASALVSEPAFLHVSYSLVDNLWIFCFIACDCQKLLVDIWP